MNFNNTAVRIAIGVMVGLQLNARLRGFIPSGLGMGSDATLAVLVVLFLAWGKGQGGAMGDIIKGVAIGAGALSASRLVKLPI